MVTVRTRKPRRVRPIRPRPRREREEFGPGKPDFLVCPDCGAVYDEKRWKASFASVADAREEKRIAFQRCPACTMVRNRTYEGQVVARGIPEDRLGDVLSRIRNIGRRAQERDPLDRIIAIIRRGRTIAVTTTENQLALRIGRALEKLLGGTLTVRWSHEEDIVRILWEPRRRSA